MLINTKQILAKALMDLSKEKSLDKITIQMIVEKCGTGRQTFYNHFKDKNDLISWIYSHKLAEITHEWSDRYSYYDCVKLGHDIYLEDKEYFKQSARISGQNGFYEALFDVIYDFYVYSITSKFGEEVLTKDIIFAIEHHCHGSCQQCLKWLKTGMKESTDYLATQIVENCPDKLKPYLI